MGMPNKAKRKFTDFDFTSDVSDAKWAELNKDAFNQMKQPDTKELENSSVKTQKIPETKTQRKFTDFDFTKDVSDTKWQELNPNADKKK